jgi:hypothetical protein
MPNLFAPECDCRTLERLVKEPEIPVTFDAALNEYHIQTSGGGHVVIYHCPHCGCHMPKSRRGELFMRISYAEQDRLRSVVQDIKTVDDALALLGPPDRDDPAGLRVTAPAADGAAHIHLFRVLIYGGLSPAAEVHATVYPNEPLHFTFRAKPVAPPGG